MGWVVGVSGWLVGRGFGGDVGTCWPHSSIAVATMLFAPKGLWGLITARYDLHLFPVGRRLIVHKED